MEKIFYKTGPDVPRGLPSSAFKPKHITSGASLGALWSPSQLEIVGPASCLPCSQRFPAFSSRLPPTAPVRLHGRPAAAGMSCVSMAPSQTGLRLAAFILLRQFWWPIGTPTSQTGPRVPGQPQDQHHSRALGCCRAVLTGPMTLSCSPTLRIRLLGTDTKSARQMAMRAGENAAQCGAPESMLSVLFPGSSGRGG